MGDIVISIKLLRELLQTIHDQKKLIAELRRTIKHSS
jgi:hypothetical protein